MNFQPGCAGYIASHLPLTDVVTRLSRQRPVFHSEADLQHSFARTVWEMAPEIECRLEVRQRTPDRREHLDLLCLGPRGRTAIEFKYFTRWWAGRVGKLREEFELKTHAAADLARLNFVGDVARLERFCGRQDQNGLSLLITNDPRLWEPPRPSADRTRDSDFRLHEGRVLTGTLLWADGAYANNTRTLRGSYHLGWRRYSELGGAGGDFRYLAVPVQPSA